MNKKVIILLLVVVIGFSAWWIYTQFRQPDIDLDTYQSLASVTADETVKLLGKKGDIVVINWESHNKMPVVEAQISSFARQIKKHDGIQIVANEKVERDPAQIMATGGAIPADQLLKIVKAHPGTGAFILFLAFPNLSSQDSQTISESPAKFVVVSGCNPGYKKLLMDRTIDLAIIPQFDRTKNTQPPKTSQESFDQNYQIVTPENAASLPY